MNKTFIGAVLLLSLAACMEKPGSPDKLKTTASQNPVVNQTSPVPPQLTYLKAKTDQPTGIPAILAEVNGACALDATNDQPAQDTIQVTDKAKLKLAGWAGNVTGGSVPQDLYIELDGAKKYYFKAVPGQSRPDVASFFKKPGLTNSGWEALADVSDLSPGSYKLKTIQIEGQGGLLCDTKRMLVLN